MSGKDFVRGRKCDECLCRYCQHPKCLGRISCKAGTCTGATVGCREACAKMIIQIHSKYFTAGLVLSDSKRILGNKICIKVAPIIKYMIGWSQEQIQDYCTKKL
jgi:hypothetical protein